MGSTPPLHTVGAEGGRRFRDANHPWGEHPGVSFLINNSVNILTQRTGTDHDDRGEGSRLDPEGEGSRTSQC